MTCDATGVVNTNTIPMSNTRVMIAGSPVTNDATTNEFTPKKTDLLAACSLV